MTAIYDDFNRANTTNNIGVSSSGHTWIQVDGTWGISSNRAYTSADSADQLNACTIEFGAADAIAAVDVMSYPAGHGGGISFRVSDANNYWAFFAYQSTTGLGEYYSFIVKVVAGVYTVVYSLGHGLTLGAGTRYEVRGSGSTLDFYIDGAFFHTVTDSFNDTATQHGLFTDAGAGVGFDNFNGQPGGITAPWRLGTRHDDQDIQGRGHPRFTADGGGPTQQRGHRLNEGWSSIGRTYARDRVLTPGNAGV